MDTLPGTHPEGATRYLRFLLTDVDGVTGLTSLSTVLTALTLDLYEARTKAAINDRIAQNIKNANGGTVYDAPQAYTDSRGVARQYNVEVRLDAADMACLRETTSERHVALVRATWGDPAKTVTYPVAFIIDNLDKV
jgi:hypothetical protein